MPRLPIIVAALPVVLLCLLMGLPGPSAAQARKQVQEAVPEAATAADAAAPSERHFSRFAASLPPGWDGEERSGFSSGDREEYMLILGVQDAAGERFLAQVSVFALPNAKGSSAEDFARQMAELQGDATPPRREGRFQVFSGEPRTQALRGRATTMVTATPERLLIIIVQDPEGLGGEQVAASLRGLTPEMRDLLGR